MDRDLLMTYTTDGYFADMNAYILELEARQPKQNNYALDDH